MGHMGKAILLAMAFVLAIAVARAADSSDEEALEGMSIEELRSYQAYYYASGGRDPLTMRLATSAELGDPNKGAAAKKAPTLEEMDRVLDKALEDILAALKARNYQEAIRVSDEVIYIIDNEWPPLKADPPRLRQKDEQIRGLNRMAGRLRAQEEIQAEFESMHLRVQGVIWSPTEAKAMINGRLLSAGELLLEERQQGDLRIEMIEEHGVVFQFKGMRFRLPVELYAPENANTP